MNKLHTLLVPMSIRITAIKTELTCGAGAEIGSICQQEELEDTKGAIIIRISKKNRQYNGQKKKYERTNNDLQNIHIKLKIE